ncbi:MAG: phosphatidate cytidylyltransferase [Actinomycetota bacterium]|jgi:CDP-diglyceride synthetase|nr:phosphatidate cytidylyltransferase [Actinomycetota bacterium]
MAEHVGPVESDGDQSSIYGDYRFEPKSAENVGSDGFQLPPWTDPPTGEIPKVLTDLDGDESSKRPRTSSVRFPSLFNSRVDEEVKTGFEGPNSVFDGERGLLSPAGRHVKRDSLRHKRPPQLDSENEALRISSRADSSRQPRFGYSKSASNAPEDVFRPPEEIVLPTKRFNVSIPKLPTRTKREVVSKSKIDPSLEVEAQVPGDANTLSTEEISERDEFLPSSFASRTERISRAKADASLNRSNAKRPLYVRVATGIGLGAVVLLAFHFGAPTALAVVVIAIVLAVIEFYDTLRRAGFRPAALLGIAGTVSLLITTYQKGANGIALVFASMVVASMLWYLVGVIRGQPTLNIAATFLGFLWIGGLGSFGAAILRPQDFPHSHGVAYLMGAIIATVANDTAAYFFGSWLGRHKLAPEISPTKSWEGLIAGAVASVIVSALVVARIAPWTVTRAVILGIIVAIVAPLGDLSESMIKRDLHIKDMGKLLPGHGGMLDRIDGLLFVLPTVYYLLKILHLS